MPRVRRLRREAPTLELLAATLPELRLGLSDSGARTLAYEVFEKLGYGAVAVTDTTCVLAFVGAGADHHAPGDAPIRPVFEALAENETRIAPLAFRVACGHSACPLGAAAIVPLRLSDGPVGSLIAYATDGALLGDDDVDLLVLVWLEHEVDRLLVGGGVLEKRRDVVEENPGFRKVGHMANHRFEIHRHLVVNPVSRPLGAMCSTSTRSTRAPDGP